MCIHYYQHIWSIIDKSYLDVQILCSGGVTVGTILGLQTDIIPNLHKNPSMYQTYSLPNLHQSIITFKNLHFTPQKITKPYNVPHLFSKTDKSPNF